MMYLQFLKLLLMLTLICWASHRMKQKRELLGSSLTKYFLDFQHICACSDP